VRSTDEKPRVVIFWFGIVTFLRLNLVLQYLDDMSHVNIIIFISLIVSPYILSAGGGRQLKTIDISSLTERDVPFFEMSS